MERTFWSTLACAAAAWLTVGGPVSAQTCQEVPVDCLQPAALAEIDGARFAWSSTAGDERDAWVARFDGEAQEPTWRIPLGGAGDDSVATVTLSHDGELLVAGATTSPVLEGIDGRNAGGRDGFVVRLDAATGRVLSGAFVGGEGDEELTGVVSDSAGNILVAGVGTLPDFGEPPAALSVIETQAAGPGSPVFLATLDRQLTRANALYSLGSLHAKHPRVWLNCQGGVVLGVAALVGPTNCAGGPPGGWPDLVYERSHINPSPDRYVIDHTFGNPFTTGSGVPGGWGYHALRWKYYYGNAHPSGPFDLNYGAAQTSIPRFGIDGYFNSPQEHPGCPDAETLNQLQGQVFFPANVPGSWACGKQTSMAELSLFVAHFFHLWTTPVYAHFNQPTGNGNWQTYAAGLDRATFVPLCPGNPNAYNGQRIEDFCTFSNNDKTYSCPLSTGIPGIVGPSGFVLAFQKFEGSSWGPSFQPGSWFQQGRQWESDVPSWFAWYDVGEFVFDPPEGGDAELATVQEAVRQSAGIVMRPGTVQVTQRVWGVPGCEQAVEAYFPADE